MNVQGFEAAEEIADAITRLDKSGRVDEIIVARGGGSREDLWVFNAEVIARAAYRCKTPIISAIGHEIDFTILDFVADQRAAHALSGGRACCARPCRTRAEIMHFGRKYSQLYPI